MSYKLFTNALIFITGKFKKSQILIKDDIITAIGNKLNIPEETEIIDCQGKRIIPGLVDIHTHGCIGHDFSTASPEEMHDMLNWYAKKGVTTVLATTMTDSKENMMAAMKNLHTIHRSQRTDKQPEAHMAGVHLEGPFFRPEYKGVHDEKYLLEIDDTFFRELFLAAGGFIRMIDIDPTLRDTFDFINEHRRDFVISVAHTACDYETAKKVSQAGVNHITHLFNAMSGLHHREPGLIGALYDFGFYADIICDGIHVHPSLLRLMFSAIPEKMVIISDSMAAAGMGDGKFRLANRDVTVKDGCATLADGTLAGSTTNMYDSMIRLIRYGIPASVAITAATESAAVSAGISKHYGAIRVGRAADFLILDMDYNLDQVWISGEHFHDAEKEQ